jgi:hypothetical protein
MHACTCPPQLAEHTTNAWRRSCHEACFFFFLMADGCDSRAISISIGPARCLFALLAS